MDDLSIIAANLSDADRLLFDSWMLRASHLADLAHAMHKRLATDGDGEDGEELLAALYGEFSERMSEAVQAPRERELTDTMSLFTRMELCKALSRAIAAPKGQMDIPLWEKAQPVIAYFHNPYAGRILQSVTDALQGGEAFAAEDYTDACEGVAEGRYDFCLLPVESSRDGIMNRFVQMIARYDLFTVLTCRLEISDEEYIRFALLAAAPSCLKIVESDPEYLQIKVVTGEEQLWELLFVAHQMGATLAECRPVSGDTAAYQLTLQVKDADMAALQYYLDMGWSRATFTGFYREILPDAETDQGLLQ